MKQRREYFAADKVDKNTTADGKVVGLDGKTYTKVAKKPTVIVDPAPTATGEGWPRSTYPFRAIDLIQVELQKNPGRKGARYNVYRSLTRVHSTVDIADELILQDEPDVLLSVSAQEAKEYRALLAEAMGQLRKLDKQLALREATPSEAL